MKRGPSFEALRVEILFPRNLPLSKLEKAYLCTSRRGQMLIMRMKRPA